MGNLIGLPGVKGGIIKDVLFFRTITKGMHLLRTERAITAAGDHGAVSVYLDDDDEYRCIFSVYGTDIDMTSFHTKTAVRGWLEVFLPKCYEAQGEHP